MPEVLVVFDAQLRSRDGRRWIAQACGAVADDNLWEGWIEFLPLEAEESPVRTPRETEQPNRNDLIYWAQGLTAVYLDGALARALEAREEIAPPNIAARPAFERAARTGHEGTGSRSMPRAILDPFEVYQQGEDVLIAQLGALEAPRLRDVAVAYGFAARSESADASREELTAMILSGARAGRSRETGETRREL